MITIAAGWPAKQLRTSASQRTLNQHHLNRNRKFVDSPLEGAVTSEPVSEAGNSLLAGKIQGISLDFAARHASIAAKEQ